MRISLNWLKQYIFLEETPEQLADILTMTGLEVEGIEIFESIKGGLKGLVVGEVLTCVQHPEADRLSLTTVDIGAGKPVQIVCGAPNVAKGQKVVVAPVGTVIYPINAEPFEIKRTKIRGEFSEGMICAEDEIGLGADHQGVIEMKTDLPNGSEVTHYFEIENDIVFEIGLTPNRGDATSHIGVARDLKAFLRRKLEWPSVDQFKVERNIMNISVEIRDKNACPRYSGISITGINVQTSPRWLQNKLESIGLSPINNIVDITNYVLNETGQPLHAFDADKIANGRVIVQTLANGTKFTTLDEVERTLSADNLMICDSNGGMCIAGVFGGAGSGITKETVNIFLESAYFSPDSIRKTSQQHGLKTDAAFRFERGTDPNLTVYALKRATMLIKEIAGGQISSEIVDEYPSQIPDREVEITYKNVDRLIGITIDRENIFSILESLDIKIENKTHDGFTAIVPPYRYDVTREADVIEEILRIYGLNNIKIPPKVSAESLAEFPQKDPINILSRTSKLLAANGFYEILTNSLTKPDYAESVDEIDTSANVAIINKLSEDLGVMRQSLLFSGLEVMAYNINRRQTDLKFFEFGKIYHKKAGGYKEKQCIGLFITGLREKENWIRKDSPVIFHDIIGASQLVVDSLCGEIITQSPSRQSIFSFGCSLKVGDRDIGIAGRINPRILKLFDISKEIFYSELDWDLLLKISNDNIVYEEVTRFPEVRRDLSLVLDKDVSFEEIRRLAQKQETFLIKEMNVFDLYEGENIGKNKKALAISFILQDKKKTLTDKVIDKTMKRLMNTFETELGAIIRK